MLGCTKLRAEKKNALKGKIQAVRSIFIFCSGGNISAVLET